MKKIVELKKTSPACPEQYEGKLETGEYVYLRCRSGLAEIRVGNQQQWDDWTLTTIASLQDEDTYLGGFGPGVLAELFRMASMTCEVNIDKLEMPHPGTAEKFMENLLDLSRKYRGEPKEDESVMLTYDMDILRGKIVIPADTLVPITEGFIKDMRNNIDDVLKRHHVN